MSNYVVTGEQMTSIADAIRAKTGETDPIVFPTGFVSDISGIETLTEKETTGTYPTSAKTIEAGATLAIASVAVPTHTKAIKRVSPTSGYNPSNMQYSYNLTRDEEDDEIDSINFFIRNKTNRQMTIEANSMSIRVISLK